MTLRYSMGGDATRCVHGVLIASCRGCLRGDTMVLLVHGCPTLHLVDDCHVLMAERGSLGQVGHGPVSRVSVRTKAARTRRPCASCCPERSATPTGGPVTSTSVASAAVDRSEPARRSGVYVRTTFPPPSI